MPGGQIHLRPTAALADRVLVPGDPGRALLLAQSVLEQPRMLNHHRGLWGYTGRCRADGEPLSIQSTGMGGPSAAIVIEELVELGARRLIRVGTCGALAPDLGLGALVIASEALTLDGCSRALGADGRVAADPALTQGLCAAAGPRARAGTVASVDLFYGALPSCPAALAVEMECSTLFTLAAMRGVRAAGILAVSDTFTPAGARQHITDAALAIASEVLGDVAVSALGPAPATVR